MGRARCSFGRVRGTVTRIHGDRMQLEREPDQLVCVVVVPPRLVHLTRSLRINDRVEVHGRYWHSGRQCTMHAEHLRPIPIRSHTPVSARDLYMGVDVTGGLGSVAYVRRLRDGGGKDGC